jgi:hypothetical protein
MMSSSAFEVGKKFSFNDNPIQYAYKSLRFYDGKRRLFRAVYYSLSIFSIFLVTLAACLPSIAFALRDPQTGDLAPF